MREPSYLKLHHEGVLRERIEKAWELLEPCILCPRECRVRRLHGQSGTCGTEKLARIASFSPHFGEERPLVGRNGSGTIFFSSCNLLCSFCQNYDISHLKQGRDVGSKQLAAIMLELQAMGCHNINFVTPSHVVPQILAALPWAAERGLRLPLVYNTGAYDNVQTLELLEGVFDIYMPDFKFWTSEWAGYLCNAPDYPERAKAAIREMHRQVGDLQINREGLAVRGLLVRHLVMPDNIAGTREIMCFIASECSTTTYVNVMNQYSPLFRADDEPRINRRISREEYRQALDWAREAGLTRLDGGTRLL